MLASANIAGFNPPLIVNYGQKYENKLEAHAAKINGVYVTLANLAKDKPPSKTVTEGEPELDNLALVIDGFDAWFQLGPEVLVERYLERTKGKTVVFGVDKECWPNKHDTAACTAAPESPLPTDAYGPETDKDKWHYKTRARYLNSGTIIGPIGDIQEIFSVSKSSLDKATAEGRVIYSDQGVIADVWGEKRTVAQIVLDYWSELFQTLTHSHNDIEWKEITGKHLAYNKITDKIPVVLHFNGPKQYLEKWWPFMWFHHTTGELKETVEAKKRNGGWVPKDTEHTSWEWKTWEELCGAYEEIFTVGKGSL